MKAVFALCLGVCLLVSCAYDAIDEQVEEKEENSAATQDAESIAREKTWKLIEAHMNDAEFVSDVRPMNGISSEKEVLLKAASQLMKEGYLNPAHFIHRDEPRLFTAKIERPVLMYFMGGSSGKGHVCYVLAASAPNGQTLIEWPAGADVSDTGYDLLRRNGYFGGLYTINDDAESYHQITEREAVALIEGKFPGREYEGPILINLQPKMMPPGFTMDAWYFVLDDGEEYAIMRYVTGKDGWNLIPGGMSNLDAISLPGNGGTGFFDGERMARLEPKLHFFDIMRDNKDTLSQGNIPFPPNIAFDFIPVPLK
ncbi:MAG: hypothetical protein LBC27_05160 [Spirochaetaceae bacterium]|jgi:hypothetical protein|nr:hypothetical protein [Spirochaetaceae bacterium]